jgi:ethanolamine utilization protein EutN
MILCKVIGNCVSTVQHPVYNGHSIMVCQPVQPDGVSKNGPEFLAVDSVLAGVGELVLVAREGNTARQILGSSNDPFHSVIVGIVDNIEDASEWKDS